MEKKREREIKTQDKQKSYSHLWSEGQGTKLLWVYYHEPKLDQLLIFILEDEKRFGTHIQQNLSQMQSQFSTAGRK